MDPANHRGGATVAFAEPLVPDDRSRDTAALPLVEASRREGPPATLPELAPGRYLALETGGDPVVLGLGEGSVRVGRSPSADLVIDDASVSRRHAVVVWRDARTVILDDRSRNGLVVNGARVQDAALSDGDEIALGNVALRYLEVAGAPV
jgi:FHA domain